MPRSVLAPLRNALRSLYRPVTNRLDSLREDALCASQQLAMENHPNPLNRCGKRVFSQNEEDGITFEILRRIGVDHGVFAEFGVGNGLENNTILLASLGWSGFWIGGQEIAFDASHPSAGGAKRDFAFLRRFIDRENIVSLTRQGLDLISESAIDVVSLDLDGNDPYLVQELLANAVLPKLFIVEYNAKFMPPIRWKIAYNPVHMWRKDDYYGASLMEFRDLFDRFGYFLVCCNAASGSNAFFVHSAYRAAFRDVPEDINLLWSPPHHRHPVSAKTVAQIIGGIASAREAADCKPAAPMRD
jgi:hypothetical protein